MKERLLWVDALRGLAIVLMVIFHFFYDLRYFGYVDWHIPNGPYWWQFRYVILTLFIFTVGLSLSLAHQRVFNDSAFMQRMVQLLLAAAAITAMSLFLFPNAWIYFGILHFIAVASVLGVLATKKPWWALGLGAVILMGYWSDALDRQWPFELFSSWLPDDTEDFVPLFPWLGVMYLGIAFAGLVPIRRHDLPRNKAVWLLSELGRRGLLVYLVHQPIFFALFYFVQGLSL